MIIATVLIALLILVAVLLVLCFLALRELLEWVSSLGDDIGSFLYDYRLIHEFDEAKRLRMSVLVDEDFKEWQKKHPGEPARPTL